MTMKQLKTITFMISLLVSVFLVAYAHIQTRQAQEAITEAEFLARETLKLKAENEEMRQVAMEHAAEARRAMAQAMLEKEAADLARTEAEQAIKQLRRCQGN